jgi:NADH-ubiquinone oxidoreductase chain 5
MYLLLFLSLFNIFIFTGRSIGHRGANFCSAITMILLFLINGIIFKYEVVDTYITLGQLISYWQYTIDLSLRYDNLTSLMLSIVLSITTIVIIFSNSYLADDPHMIRYLSYINLFINSMFILILSKNLFVLLIGWEFVGLSSYLLVNYWYTRLQSNWSSLKALLMNRIGDMFLMLGIMLLYNLDNTYEITIIDYNTNKLIINMILIGLFIGAMAKSAQIGLQSWLTSAMEAPTPISALIHAATMVTVGIYLLIRLNPLLAINDNFFIFILWLGSITALYGSTGAMMEYDIKKIIAFSTVSQLGYMASAIGLSYYSLAFSHLFNHAFYKALLFLTSGMIIYGTGYQDIRKISNYSLWSIYIFIIIGSLNLIAFPFTLGFNSKELILDIAFYNNRFVYFNLFMAAILTSLYSIKLCLYIFKSKSSRSSNSRLTTTTTNTTKTQTQTKTTTPTPTPTTTTTTTASIQQLLLQQTEASESRFRGLSTLLSNCSRRCSRQPNNFPINNIQYILVSILIIILFIVPNILDYLIINIPLLISIKKLNLLIIGSSRSMLLMHSIFFIIFILLLFNIYYRSMRQDSSSSSSSLLATRVSLRVLSLREGVLSLFLREPGSLLKGSLKLRRGASEEGTVREPKEALPIVKASEGLPDGKASAASLREAPEEAGDSLGAGLSQSITSGKQRLEHSLRETTTTSQRNLSLSKRETTFLLTGHDERACVSREVSLRESSLELSQRFPLRESSESFPTGTSQRETSLETQLLKLREPLLSSLNNSETSTGFESPKELGLQVSLMPSTGFKNSRETLGSLSPRFPLRETSSRAPSLLDLSNRPGFSIETLLSQPYIYTQDIVHNWIIWNYHKICQILYRYIDRGILEIFGPFGPIKLFQYLSFIIESNRYLRLFLIFTILIFGVFQGCSL